MFTKLVRTDIKIIDLSDIIRDSKHGINQSMNIVLRLNDEVEIDLYDSVAEVIGEDSDFFDNEGRELDVVLVSMWDAIPLIYNIAVQTAKDFDDQHLVEDLIHTAQVWRNSAKDWMHDNSAAADRTTLYVNIAR